MGIGAPHVRAAQAAQAQSSGWNDGFVLQSSDGDFRMLFGLVLQADGRFALDDPAPTIDTFTIRKVRPTFSGRVGRFVNFRIMPDFGSGDVSIQDAWIELAFSPAMRVRVGKDKAPVGYEMLLSDPWVLFPERSLANSLVPNRDIGVQVQGDLPGGQVFYAVGLMNGVPDGASSADDRDTNNSKDIVGRVILRPFVRDDAPLRGLGVQLGGSTGTQRGALPTFRSAAGQTYFAYEGGAEATGRRNRLTPAVFMYRGPFGAYVEYMRSSQPVGLGGLERDVVNTAWNATVSYVLTGENTSATGVSPAEPFTPETGGPGAVQIIARYAELRADEEAFLTGLAGSGSSERASSFGVGIDWYLSDYIKYYTTFEHTSFEDGFQADRGENVVFVRLQLSF